jgi:hypothetical protein
MLSHLRTEAYPVYRSHQYPPVAPPGSLSFERNNELIELAKRALEAPTRADAAEVI